MDRGDWQATVHGVTMTERLIAHIARNCRRSKLVKTETTQRKKGEHSFMEERRKLGGVALSRNSLEKGELEAVEALTGCRLGQAAVAG